MADRVSSVIRVLQRAGFKGPELKTAFGIAMRESGGNPRAFNPDRSTGDQSYGLFQINMLGNMGPSRRKAFGIQSDQQLLDPLTNARAAYKLSKGGTDFGPWGIGPNAYRGGAGYETIAPFVAKFPGAPSDAGETPPGAAALPSGRAPGGNPALLFDLIAASRARRGAEPSPIFDLLAQRATARPAATRGVSRRRTASVTRPVRHGNVLTLPTSWKGTHETDNLGWGTKTAEDIMAPPGTPVGAPESGTIRYFHPAGAQGGGSMELVTDSGYVYWLGHIADGLPAGTRVKRGQPLAVVANQNVSAPHVHEDKRRVA